jgi:hypothetical protein
MTRNCREQKKDLVNVEAQQRRYRVGGMLYVGPEGYCGDERRGKGLERGFMIVALA